MKILTKKEMRKTKGGISDLTNWLLSNISRHWMRLGHDPYYKEAFDMCHKM